MRHWVISGEIISMVSHIAIQMDGNRRWAKQNGYESYIGHYYGAQTAQKAIEFCLNNNIPHLSLYTLSIENLKRSQEEKSYIFNLLISLTEKYLSEYISKGVKIKFIGNRSLSPANVIEMCNKIEEKTKDLNKLQVNLLFCYGSRQEILDATKKIAAKVASGELSEMEITDELFAKYLWTNESPEPDIIIIPGGKKRISNFLLYQSAYSEYFFLDYMWPDIKELHLEDVVNQFKTRKRNFGV